MVLKQIKLFDDEVNIKFFDVFYPIGSTYTQYPGQPSPNELWGDYSVWEELDYHGAFFRANGGEADTFNKMLTVSTQSGTTITFSTDHGLITNSILYDYEHNESRRVTSISTSKRVIIDSAFTNTVSKVIVTQNDALASHSHTMGHAHSAKSTSTVSLDTTCYSYIDVVDVRYSSSRCALAAAYYNSCGFNDAGWTTWNINTTYTGWVIHANTTTSVTDFSGNTTDTGGEETRQRNMTKKIWRRIS